MAVPDHDASPQGHYRSIVRRIDHIVIKTDDPYALFSLFANTLQFPVVWGVREYDFFVSCGVFAGNVYLEAVRFGPTQNVSSTKPAKAIFWGVAFEPHCLHDSLDELAKRNIPHSPPFYSIGVRIDGEKGLAWTNVTLGKLLDDGGKTVYLGRRWGGNSLVNITLGKLSSKLLAIPLVSRVIAKMMGGTMIYICEYTHDNAKLMDLAKNDLISRGGGEIGLDYVKEVILGVTDFENRVTSWENLLKPTEPSSQATWRLENGPFIRLIPNQQNAINALVLKVHSLAKAKAYLTKEGMCGEVTEDHVCIAKSIIQGLDIRLVE